MLTLHQEKERGQSIIVIAFIVIVLLALVAVVVDVGNAYAQRRVVQNAVDSAAMSGVKILTQGLMDGNDQFFAVTDDLVMQGIEDYAEINSLDPNDVVAWYIDDDAQRLRQVGTTPGSLVPRKLTDANGVLQDVEGVEVMGDLPFNTYFAHLIGFPTMTATAPAQAWVMAGPCSGDNLFPIAMLNDFDGNDVPQAGVEYTMWDAAYPNAGSFGWVHWGDTGFSEPGGHAQGGNDTCLEQNMHWTSRSGFWEVDDLVPTTTGVGWGNKIQKQLECRIKGPGANNDCDEWNTDPTVVIPIYDVIHDPQGSNLRYEIIGFGAFHLICAQRNHGTDVIEAYPGACADSDCIDHPDDKCVRGYFEREVVPVMNGGCMDTGITAPSFRKP